MSKDINRAIKIARTGISDDTIGNLDKALFTGKYMYVSDGYQLFRLNYETLYPRLVTIHQMEAGALEPLPPDKQEAMFLKAIGIAPKTTYNLDYEKFLNSVSGSSFYYENGFVRNEGKITMSYDTEFHYNMFRLESALYLFEVSDNKIRLQFRNHSHGEMLTVEGGDLFFALMPKRNENWRG